VNKQEAIDWFWDKYNSCYPVAHDDYPQSIFLYYDSQFVRKMKFEKISGQCIMPPSVINGICLFEQDWKNKYYYYKYNKIYKFLYDNYDSNYKNIKLFINDRLIESDKMKVLTPRFNSNIGEFKLNDSEKMKVLIPWNKVADSILNDTGKITIKNLFCFQNTESNF
jgi:hypothetical protein